MESDPLNEREFELINIVGKKLGSNQRDLSRHMNMSLGMVNMLVKRLISKGYIRIRQLNKKKVEYMLTPKGFSEKMRKSVKYTLNTINSFGLIQGQLKRILIRLYDEGYRKFYVYGEHDLGNLIEWTFNSMSLDDIHFSRIKEIPQKSQEGVILLCKEEPFETQGKENTFINMITELAQEAQRQEVAELQGARKETLT